jgi:hypothetical protein
VSLQVMLCCFVLFYAVVQVMSLLYRVSCNIVCLPSVAQPSKSLTNLPAYSVDRLNQPGEAQHGSSTSISFLPRGFSSGGWWLNNCPGLPWPDLLSRRLEESKTRNV